MKSAVIHVYGSNECEVCANQILAIKYYSLPFVYIDANDPKNKEVCDKHKIDMLPTVHVVVNNTDHVLASHVGFIDPKAILDLAIENLRNKTQKTNIQKEEKCQSCQKKNQK